MAQEMPLPPANNRTASLRSRLAKRTNKIVSLCVDGINPGDKNKGGYWLPGKSSADSLVLSARQMGRLLLPDGEMPVLWICE